MSAHAPDRDANGLSRRGLLKCSAWAGTGVVWALAGGVPRAFALDAMGAGEGADPHAFHFLQISDTHIGFNKAANPDPAKTLDEAIARVNAMPVKPGLILHTGDITHLSKPEQFEAAEGQLQSLPAPIRFVPGEHDVQDEGAGANYLARHGQGTKGAGWYSFDDHGVHFIALINVTGFAAGALTTLGPDQLAWLADDLRAVRHETPIVVFAHIPLWTVWEPYGWGTADAGEAMTLLAPYGSVTVLNGHIHQVIQKVEGHIAFHTGRSTAYPQPAPGAAPAAGPLTVPAEQLRSYLGLTSATWRPGRHDLALANSTLA
jgi:hypothetical protein